MSTVHPTAPRLTTDRLHALRGRLYGSAHMLLVGPPTSQVFQTVTYRLRGEHDSSGGTAGRLLAALSSAGGPELRREYAALFGATPPAARFDCRRGQRAPCTRAYWEVSGHVAEASPVEDLDTLARLAIETAYLLSSHRRHEAERLSRLQAEFLRSAGGCIRRLAGFLQRDGGLVYRQLGAVLAEQLQQDRHLFAAQLHHRHTHRA